MIANDKVLLLADAEFGEDGVEEVGGGDVAGDGADVVHNLADILAQQVSRDAALQGIHSRVKRLLGKA